MYTIPLYDSHDMSWLICFHFVIIFSSHTHTHIHHACTRVPTHSPIQRGPPHPHIRMYQQLPGNNTPHTARLSVCVISLFTCMFYNIHPLPALHRPVTCSTAVATSCTSYCSSWLVNYSCRHQRVSIS